MPTELPCHVGLGWYACSSSGEQLTFGFEWLVILNDDMSHIGGWNEEPAGITVRGQTQILSWRQ